MKKLDINNEKDLKLPKDIPEGFFNIVSKLLSFVEVVDENKSTEKKKNKKKNHEN